MLLAGLALSTVRQAHAQAAPTLEGLLKKAGFDYAKTPEGAFKVIVEYKDETSIIYADEVSVGSDPKKPELRLVRLATAVANVPENFKHPAPMLKKIAVLNDTLLVGRLSVGEKEGDVWYGSTFWLRTADDVVTSNELFLAHFNRVAFRKELKPFITE
jgi:hypothetical protein